MGSLARLGQRLCTALENAHVGPQNFVLDFATNIPSLNSAVFSASLSTAALPGATFSLEVTGLLVDLQRAEVEDVLHGTDSGHHHIDVLCSVRLAAARVNVSPPVWSMYCGRVWDAWNTNLTLLTFCAGATASTLMPSLASLFFTDSVNISDVVPLTLALGPLASGLPLAIAGPASPTTSVPAKAPAATFRTSMACCLRRECTLLTTYPAPEAHTRPPL